jgi:hypothetical protein
VLYNANDHSRTHTLTPPPLTHSYKLDPHTQIHSTHTRPHPHLPPRTSHLPHPHLPPMDLTPASPPPPSNGPHTCLTLTSLLGPHTCLTLTSLLGPHTCLTLTSLQWTSHLQHHTMHKWKNAAYFLQLTPIYTFSYRSTRYLFLLGCHEAPIVVSVSIMCESENQVYTIIIHATFHRPPHLNTH